MLSQSRQLQVAGLTALTTVDWPEHLAAVVFTRGCPWACPYCHNPELQRTDGQSRDWDQVLRLLDLRRGLLDGVVFSGGEPCLQPGLADALAEVRALGFGTALHTSGAFPERLAGLLEAGLIDWVGLDIKAPFEDYPQVTGRAGSGDLARQSLAVLIRSGVPHELRTTVWPRLLTSERLDALAGQLARAGAIERWVLQPCLEQPGARPAAASWLASLAEQLATRVGPIAIRA